MLAADFKELGKEIRAIEENGAEYLHFDVMDGHFVPNISIGVPVVKSLRKATTGFLDVHLMISQPEKYIDAFAKAGADLLNLHVEADGDMAAMLKHIRELGCKSALTIKPNTPAEAVAPYLSKVDLVLVMTVEPGFGGQKFMADMMPKVKKIRQFLDLVNPSCHLEVDGGVDMTNCQLCKDSGSDVLVAGSAYFKAADKISFVQELEK